MNQNKLTQLAGNLDGAVTSYKAIIEKENELFHKIAHWELMWTSAVQCNWDEAIKYAQLLREKTLHSPAIVTYLEGVFRYTKGKLENNPKCMDEASALFEKVPTLRIRYLGKTMTLEKAVIVQSQRYFKNGKKMILPVMVRFSPPPCTSSKTNLVCVGIVVQHQLCLLAQWQ